ncbi:LPS assembly lipoprotein LptE [Vreelandella rituensis]|uniref:LPS-assembly lipoprotein LptE n=1 Tax=Vreelandella rituensis TaxID=2282306 RepID=A0A368U3S5_9GAMM|nr:LPS assembly lipoprotein LptE [Halomonas rituensis]RCV90752.1 hypothetical protein DU506_11060 [Halomonas rituensis]
MKRRDVLYALAAGALAPLLLSGCGFQLRGSDMPTTLPELSLAGDTESGLAREFISRLQRAGSGVSDQAPWVVTLGTPRLEERTLGGEGRASRDHELTLRASVALQERSDDTYHLHTETLSTSTRIRVNDDDLLNREALFSEARGQLEKQLAQKILARLVNVASWQ